MQNGRDQLNIWRAFDDMQNAEPYCYFDSVQNKRVEAPEYGGDGRMVAGCAKYARPVATFPAHYAPLDLLFYTGAQFPSQYRNGVFVAFHGSWNRAPLPSPGDAKHRPVGLAQSPDGSLYVSDDVGGRIWKISYTETP